MSNMIKSGFVSSVLCSVLMAVSFQRGTHSNASEAIYNWDHGHYGFGGHFQEPYAPVGLEGFDYSSATAPHLSGYMPETTTTTTTSSIRPELFGYKMTERQDFDQQRQQPHRMSSKRAKSRNKPTNAHRVQNSVAAASTNTQEDIDSMPRGFHSMDTLSAMDLEIEPNAQGLPPTVKIETRNGQPYVEIVATQPGATPKLEITPYRPTKRGGDSLATTKRTTTKPMKSMSNQLSQYRVRENSNEFPIQLSQSSRKQASRAANVTVSKNSYQGQQNFIVIDGIEKKGTLSEGADWSYEDEDNWGKKFSSCDGYAQSPINIHPNSLYEENRLSLNFMNSYNMLIEETELINNGHTVQINYMGGPRPSLTGTSCFGDAFYFEQVHFHWGSKNTIGSEHSVFGLKFPLEMHLVHFNEKYGSLREAADKPDGLAVLAVFFQVSEKDNPRFEPLIESFNAIRCGGQAVQRNGVFNLSWFLPANRRQFYRYKGSLTTPPCHESVTWIIFKHGLLIGRNQLKRFRELRQEDCKTPILNNWRNIQATNGRRVERALVSFPNSMHSYFFAP